MRAKRALDGLDGDIRHHIERETQDNIERGLPPEEARRQAMLRFGNTVLVKENTRAIWVSRWLDEMRQDVRYAFRTLRNNPAYATVVVVILALGVGANTAIFSLVDAVLLRVLPVQRPQELVFLQSAGSEGLGGAPPYPCFQRFRTETSAFAGMAAFAADELRVEVDGLVEQVFGQVASGSYFEVLGVTPATGRLMTMEDETLDPPVAVIGHGYWQRRFGGDPGAVGRTISFRNRSYTIVGVTPAGFRGLHPGRHVDLTLPITEARGLLADGNRRWFDVVARLRFGAGIEQATAQTDTVFKSFMKDRDVSDGMRSTRFDRMVLTPAGRGLDGLRKRFSSPLYALTVAAVVVLLIACLNLGNLLLARGAVRAREFAIRLAIGAASGRLFRQLLTETLLLFLIGAGAGLLIARAVATGLTGFFAIGRNPILIDVQYDWRVAAFAASVALAAGVVTGLWPAWRAVRTDPQAATKEGDTRLAGSPRSPFGGVVVVGQVALSLVLLVTALMFVKTMVNLRAVDLGFSGHHVITMSLIPAFPGQNTADARRQFWTGVLDRVRALPGVRAAGLSVLTPLSGRDTGRGVAVAGFQPHNESDAIVRLNHVSEDYFRTFDIELLSGRAFTPQDAENAVKVAVLNETAAKFYFAGRSPLGETLRFGESAYQVVGVVRDHKHKTVREEVPRFAFVPLWQPLDDISRITLAVSSDQPSSTIARVVAAEVRAIHANTLVSDVIEAKEQIDATLVSERLLSILATAFAGLALGLAAVGLFGILSYSVTRRKAEFGVRMALGAPRSRVASSVLRDVLVQVAAGTVIGVPIAMAATRAAEGLLFGVRAGDPANYLISAAVVLLVACAAAWVPARRACSFEPSQILRQG